MILIGRPSDLYDIQSEDWGPTLKLGHNRQQPITSGSDGAQPNEQTTMENNNEQQITDHADSRPQQLPCAVVDPVVFDDEHPTFDINNEISCQTDFIISDINGIKQDDENIRSELYELRSKAMNLKLNEQSFKDEEKVKYYTELPNFLVLMQVFHLCKN